MIFLKESFFYSAAISCLGQYCQCCNTLLKDSILIDDVSCCRPVLLVLQQLVVGNYCWCCIILLQGSIVSATVPCSQKVLLVLQYLNAGQYCYCCSILLKGSIVSAAVCHFQDRIVSDGVSCGSSIVSAEVLLVLQYLIIGEG